MRPKNRVPHILLALVIANTIALSLVLGSLVVQIHTRKHLQEQIDAIVRQQEQDAQKQPQIVPQATTTVETQEQEDNEPEVLDIPLAPELQLVVFEECEKAKVDPATLFAIMYRESRFDVEALGYNTNGTYDLGLCQINSANHAWLAKEGFDVAVPEDNIRAAVYILDLHLEKYPLKEALAAYAVGEGNMYKGLGMWHADEVLKQRMEYIKDERL